MANDNSVEAQPAMRRSHRLRSLQGKQAVPAASSSKPSTVSPTGRNKATAATRPGELVPSSLSQQHVGGRSGFLMVDIKEPFPYFDPSQFRRIVGPDDEDEECEEGEDGWVAKDAGMVVTPSDIAPSPGLTMILSPHSRTG